MGRSRQHFWREGRDSGAGAAGDGSSSDSGRSDSKGGGMVTYRMGSSLVHCKVHQLAAVHAQLHQTPSLAAADVQQFLPQRPPACGIVQAGGSEVDNLALHITNVAECLRLLVARKLHVRCATFNKAIGLLRSRAHGDHATFFKDLNQLNHAVTALKHVDQVWLKSVVQYAEKLVGDECVGAYEVETDALACWWTDEGAGSRVPDPPIASSGDLGGGEIPVENFTGEVSGDELPHRSFAGELSGGELPEVGADVCIAGADGDDDSIQEFPEFAGDMQVRMAASDACNGDNCIKSEGGSNRWLGAGSKSAWADVSEEQSVNGVDCPDYAGPDVSLRVSASQDSSVVYDEQDMPDAIYTYGDKEVSAHEAARLFHERSRAVDMWAAWRVFTEEARERRLRVGEAAARIKAAHETAKALRMHEATVKPVIGNNLFAELEQQHKSLARSLNAKDPCSANEVYVDLRRIVDECTLLLRDVVDHAGSGLPLSD